MRTFALRASGDGSGLVEGLSLGLWVRAGGGATSDGGVRTANSCVGMGAEGSCCSEYRFQSSSELLRSGEVPTIGLSVKSWAEDVAESSRAEFWRCLGANPALSDMLREC
jgi:hypothetical protein